MSIVLPAGLTILFGLCYYLWTFEYKPVKRAPGIQHATQPTAVPRTVRLTSTLALLQPQPESHLPWRLKSPVIAEFRISNSGTTAARVLDSPALDMLFDLWLTDPEGNRATQKMYRVVRVRRTDATANKYTIVDLLPGRTLTFSFSIHKIFKIRQAGNYLLEVSYNPRRLASAQELNLGDLGVTASIKGDTSLAFVLGNKNASDTKSDQK